jgi:hypothetical protein
MTLLDIIIGKSILNLGILTSHDLAAARNSAE